MLTGSHTAGIVKLPVIARSNVYGLGRHAIKALRDAQQAGTLPTQTHCFTQAPQSEPSRSQLTTASNRGYSRGAQSPAFVLSPFSQPLTSRSPSPYPALGITPSPSVPVSAVGRQRSANTAARASAAQVSQPAAAAAGDAAADSPGPAAASDELEDDPLPDLNPDDDELTERLLSLPNIMCHAANGDVFLVGLK